MSPRCHRVGELLAPALMCLGSPLGAWGGDRALHIGLGAVLSGAASPAFPDPQFGRGSLIHAEHRLRPSPRARPGVALFQVSCCTLPWPTPSSPWCSSTGPYIHWELQAHGHNIPSIDVTLVKSTFWSLASLPLNLGSATHQLCLVGQVSWPRLLRVVR